MHLKIAALLLLSTFSVSVARAGEGSDEHFVLGSFFCQMRAGGAERPVRYLLTRSLLEEIDQAEEKNEKIAAEHPDEKPPLGDGIPFQSFPDQADSCTPTSVDTVGGIETMDISYTFTATPDANWVDKVVVKHENGRLLIDDVLYGSEKHAVGLRKTLVDAFARQ